MIMRLGSIFLLLSFLSFALAQEKKKEIPFLGPGTDLLSPEEYIQVYSRYIRESLRWGFTLDKCEESSCERSLSYLFRMAGLFSYPVPSGANISIWRHSKGIRECYATGGVVIQLDRGQTGVLKKVFVLYSRTPAAANRLKSLCKKQKLELEQDKKTGLEKVAGIPVGYPHPMLCSGSQGLFVRELSYTQNQNTCFPEEYRDNSWTSGHMLSAARCANTKKDFEQAWSKKISIKELARRERKRQHERILSLSIKKGMKKEEAKESIEKYFVGPIDSQLVYTGMAMRNIELCNILGIGSRWKGYGKEKAEPRRKYKGKEAK